MIGGTIVAMRQKEDRLCITVAQHVYNRHEFCCVDVAITDHKISIGDSLWWQSGTCYWTPRGEKGSDIPIPKIGYSYTPPDIEASRRRRP